MPCSAWREGELDPSRFNSEQLLNAAIKKSDEATQLLCYLCTRLEGQELFKHILSQNPKLDKWWKKHKKLDAKRKKTKK